MAEAFDGSEAVFGTLVVSGGEAKEVRDPGEEAFDQIALAIEWEALLAVGARRDVNQGALASKDRTDGFTVISVVGEERRLIVKR